MKPQQERDPDIVLSERIANEVTNAILNSRLNIKILDDDIEEEIYTQIFGIVFQHVGTLISSKNSFWSKVYNWITRCCRKSKQE